MRVALINQLADMWREAETDYINSGLEDSSKKDEAFFKTKEANLTDKEKQELDDICQAYGV